jgi:arylsulfatase
VIDIVPTLLEATGIPAPVMVDGIAQKPIEGVSMVYTFDKANADAPSRRRTQYFEMMGVQGLYNDGWMLSAIPLRTPWELLGKVTLDPASAFKFELHDLRHDWTLSADVAAANPARVREMTALMFGEFAKYNVLPLDASMATRAAAPRPELAAGRRVFTYSGKPVIGIPDNAAPNLLNTSYTITANIEVPQGGAEGAIVSEGGRFGGYGLYLLKGKPVFTWTPGKHTIEFDFKYDGLGFATCSSTTSAALAIPARDG